MVIPKAGLATINKKNTSKAAKEIIKREANCFFSFLTPAPAW